MDLVNREVIHGTFGKGNVIKCDDSYIRISFKSGDKRFVFPDAFKEFITFSDQKASDLVKKKLEIKEEKIRMEELLLQEERELEKERLAILEQEKKMKNNKIHPSIQSVFWLEEKEEEDMAFQEWKVFTGEIKSGQNKGEPRKLVRMNQKSACLLTKRKDDIEKERQILGLFMANETFNGRECEDGYITAHKDYRIQLSEEEADKMLFWNYYKDEKFPERTTWNSGKQRYFDNIWTAQILQDILSLKKDPEEEKHVQNFLEYFCKINLIDKDNIPTPSGALVNS